MEMLFEVDPLDPLLWNDPWPGYLDVAEMSFLVTLSLYSETFNEFKHLKGYSLLSVQLKGSNKFDIADNPSFEENLVEVSKSVLDERENMRSTSGNIKAVAAYQTNSIWSIKVTTGYQNIKVAIWKIKDQSEKRHLVEKGWGGVGEAQCWLADSQNWRIKSHYILLNHHQCRLTKLNKTVVIIFLVTVNVDGRRRWKKGYFPQQNLDMWHPLTAQCHSMKDLQN